MVVECIGLQSIEEIDKYGQQLLTFPLFGKRTREGVMRERISK